MTQYIFRSLHKHIYNNNNNSNFRFAADIVVNTEEEEEEEEEEAGVLVDRLDTTTTRYKMEIRPDQTRQK